MHRKKESSIERKNQTMYKVEREYLSKIKTEDMIMKIIASKLQEKQNH